MTKTKTKTVTKKQISNDLSEFFTRYAAILHAAREFIALVGRAAAKTGEDPFVTTQQVVEHIATHLPATYLKTFGTDEPKKLKVWRLKTILSNASYLGAYEALGIRALRGRGLSIETGRRGRLRVIKGGRS